MTYDFGHCNFKETWGFDDQRNTNHNHKSSLGRRVIIWSQIFLFDYVKLKLVSLQPWK